MKGTVGAIDIGGTKLAATIARADGPALRMSAPTPKSGSIRAVPERAIALLDEVCQRIGIDPRDVQTVGVSSCGPFSRHDGLLGLVTPNICGARSNVADLPNDWDVIPIESVLRQRFEHVVIENDAVSALAAERSFGALQGENNCAYVTWSTGIGFGLCVDGHILRGKNGNAGHAGHMLLSDSSNALCGCGNYGDLEGLVSGRNLGNRFGQSAAAIFDAARKGDAQAIAATREAARWFGRALYNVTATLDINAFAIGGSVWLNHGEWLLPMVQEEIASRFPALTQGVRVETTSLGIHIGDLAAFSLVLPSDWVPAWRASSPWRLLAQTSV